MTLNDPQNLRSFQVDIFLFFGHFFFLTLFLICLFYLKKKVLFHFILFIFPLSRNLSENSKISIFQMSFFSFRRLVLVRCIHRCYSFCTDSRLTDVLIFWAWWKEKQFWYWDVVYRHQKMTLVEKPQTKNPNSFPCITPFNSNIVT